MTASIMTSSGPRLELEGFGSIQLGRSPARLIFSATLSRQQSHLTTSIVASIGLATSPSESKPCKLMDQTRLLWIKRRSISTDLASMDYEGDQIVRMNVDGSERMVLIDTGLNNVTSFTRNAQDKCLYWVNAPGIIERYDTLTKERSTLHNISAMIGRIEQIVVYNGVFYWADSIRGGIGYIGLQNPAMNGFTIYIRNQKRDDYNILGITDLKVFIDEEDEETVCSDPTGVLYRGTLAETINGRTCQAWTSQSPHQHNRTPANYPNSGLGDHNYCRNPDGDSTAWCYTTDSSKRYDYCAVGYLSPAFQICKACSSSPCVDGATCVNQNLSYVCLYNNTTIPTTSTMVNPTAHSTLVPAKQVTNPCLEYPCDRLHGFCVNEGGKPTCTCISGFELADDGVTCQPNENCTHCGHGECVPNDGMFECICGEGFALGGGEHTQCDDINECESSPCDPEYGECVNTVGAFYCTCPQGFVIGQDGVTCQVNCMEESPCSNGATCVDNQCICPDGFAGVLCQQDGTDDDITDADKREGGDPECESVDEIRSPRIPKSVIIIIVIIIIIIVVVVIVIVVVCYRRKKAKKSKPSP